MVTAPKASVIPFAKEEAGMSNQLAIFLGIVILIGVGIDYMFFDFSNLLFLSRKMLDLVHYVAFWR